MQQHISAEVVVLFHRPQLISEFSSENIEKIGI